MQITVNMIFESGSEFGDWARTVGLTPAQDPITPEPAKVSGSTETELDETAREISRLSREAEKAAADKAADTPPKKRTRRTKKQIEADAAEAAPKAETTDAAAPSEDAEPPVASGNAPATGLEPVPENNVAIMRAFIAEQGSAALIAKLKEYGVKRIHEVAPERMTEFLTELVAGS